MDIAALRRAFRARPGTAGCNEIAAFLEELGTAEEPNEIAWRRFVCLLERDVVPVVSRCHPTVEVEEISSVCVVGAFEGRHPAAISRRVRNLQDLCRAQLLDH
jgi:hypothetical protein